MKKNQEDQLEKESKLQKQLCYLNVENQWLVNVLKMNGGDIEEDMERIKKELNEEKDKVKDLDFWKSQLLQKSEEHNCVVMHRIHQLWCDAEFYNLPRLSIANHINE